MSANVFKFNDTGTAALSHYAAVPPRQHYRLVSATLNLSAAPTTSENLTITLYAAAGGIYSTLLYSLDLAAGATADLVWMSDEELILEGNDQVAIEWVNSDTRNYGAQITFKAV